MTAARARLAAAGVVFVDADLAGLAELNDKVSFPVALHEPIADIPAYLAATGVSGIGITEIAAQIASPDVKGAFGAIQGDVMGAGYNDAIRVFRPQLQALYAELLPRATGSTRCCSRRPSPPPSPSTRSNGSGKFSIDGGPLVDTFAHLHPQHRPGQQRRHSGPRVSGRA